MIPLQNLKARRLSSAKPGDFFLPGVADGERFLVGMFAQKFVMGLILEGERPFYCSELETWSGRRGLIVPDYEFEVDPASAHPVDQLQLGALILDDGNVSLYSVTRTPSRHALLIRGESDQVGSDAVAFSRWRIVVRVPNAPAEVLFSYSAPKG